jgi:hypothetical protein
LVVALMGWMLLQDLTIKVCPYLCKITFRRYVTFYEF